MNLSQLLTAIQSTHEQAQRYAYQQVNNSLTTRNRVTGFYLFQFEQNGEDRAVYGAKLYKTIAENLKTKGLKGFSYTALHQYKQFYQTYPGFIQTVSELFTDMNSSIVQTVSEQSQNTDNESIAKQGTVSAVLKFLTLSGKLETESLSQTEAELSFPSEVLLSRLSFSHFIELLNAETPLKRAFYEVQAVKNNWSVRELNRALVEYATAGLPQEVFVSKYLVQLPTVEELKMLIVNDRRKYNEK